MNAIPTAADTERRAAGASKVTRINPGIYDVVVGGVRYEVERYPDGQWLTFLPGKSEHSPRDYLQNYATKRAAIRGLSAMATGGAA